MDPFSSHINLGGFSAAERLQIQQMLENLRPHPPPSSQTSTSRSVSSTSQTGTNTHSTPHHEAQQIAPYRSIQVPVPNAMNQASAADPLTTQQRLRTAASVPSNVPAPSQHVIGQPLTPSFLGFQSMRSQVNQQRLAAASVNLPRNNRAPASHTLQPRVSRRSSRSARGVAVAAPNLPSLRGVDGCFDYDEYGHPSALNLRIKVYPPTIRDLGNGTFVYRFLRESFNAALEHLGLLFDVNFPPNTEVTALIRHVQNEMETGAHQYRFATRGSRSANSESMILPHEALALTPLGLVNRGRARADGHVRLQPRPGQSLTLQALTTNTNLFAHPTLCIEGSRFVLHLIALRGPLSGIIHPEDLTRARRLSCISQWLYPRFPNDGQMGSEISDSEVEEPLLQVVQAGRPATRSQSNSAQMPPEESPTQGHILPPSQPASPPTSTAVAAFPTQLWATPLTPVWTAGLITLEQGLDSSIFAEAVEGLDPPMLSLSGLSVAQLADDLIEEVRTALESGDFTKVLSSEREFRIISPGGIRQNIISFGRGVEIETLHMAFEQFKNTSSQWFLPRAGDYSSVAISQLLIPASISSTRRTNLSILGALTGLMVVYGLAPLPFGPALLQFFLHDCNFEVLTSEFISEWYPQLHHTLRAWLGIEPSDDNLEEFQSHFATYHEAETGAFYGRNSSSHQAIAVEMLYRAVIGPAPPAHPELQAFMRGFKLECNNGFSLLQLRELVQGGTDALLNHLWTTQIKTFADIANHLRFPEPHSTLSTQLGDALSRHGQGLTFQKLVLEFLQGTGVPSLPHFKAAKDHFSGIVDLTGIDKNSFRPKVFSWAITGSPSVDVGSAGLSIYLCSADDVDYLPLAGRVHQAMMDEGKICFKTCLKQAKVPASFIEKLAMQVYPTSGPDPFFSFEQAFNHWLLCELLSAIGNHSIL